MRLKIIILILLFIGVLLLFVFNFGIKELAKDGILGGISEYDCEVNEICTSCKINGSLCSCGEHKCSCGNETVEKTRCEL